MKTIWPFPTILLMGVGISYASQLRKAGYLILESHDDIEALELARLHSRRIHILLAEEGEASRALAAKLHHYRPEMRLLFVDWNADKGIPDSVAPHGVLQKIKEILEPDRPQSASAGAGTAQ
jgi:hypothetical protein